MGLIDFFEITHCRSLRLRMIMSVVCNYSNHFIAILTYKLFIINNLLHYLQLFHKKPIVLRGLIVKR